MTVLERDGIALTEDADSFNVDLNGDGVADLSFKKKKLPSQVTPMITANGFLVDDLGTLQVGNPPIIDYAMGLPFNAAGALVIQVNQPVSQGDAYVGGIRVGPLGGVYAVDTNPACWRSARQHRSARHHGRRQGWFGADDHPRHVDGYCADHLRLPVVQRHQHHRWSNVQHLHGSGK